MGGLRLRLSRGSGSTRRTKFGVENKARFLRVPSAFTVSAPKLGTLIWCCGSRVAQWCSSERLLGFHVTGISAQELVYIGQRELLAQGSSISSLTSKNRSIFR